MRGLRLLVASRLLPLLVLTAALLGCLSRSVLGLLGSSGCRVLCLACCLSGGIACTLGSLARALPHFVDGLSCATTDIFHCRACAFADVLYGFSDALYRLPSARPDVLHCRARTLAHVFYGFTSSLPNIFYGGSRAVANGRDGLVSSFAHQVTGALAHILYGGSGSLTHVLDRGTHTPSYLFDDLWVAIYGGHYAIQDSSHVVEPHLHERLNLDAIYRELDPAQVRVDPNREFHQIEHLRKERDLRPQVV